MDWISVFLLIFSLIVLIVAIIDAIYFYKAYSLPAAEISTGTSLTLFITNVIVAIIALAGIIWSLYVLFVKSTPTTTMLPTPSVVPTPRTTCINGVRVLPTPSSSFMVK